MIVRTNNKLNVHKYGLVGHGEATFYKNFGNKKYIVIAFTSRLSELPNSVRLGKGDPTNSIPLFCIPIQKPFQEQICDITFLRN